MNYKIVRRAAWAAFAGAVFFGGSALAADLGGRRYEGGYKDEPVYAPPSSWTGFYLGLNGGGAFAGQSDPVALGFTAGGPYSVTNTMETEGGFGGGQIGYNWQNGGVVLGLETDIQWGDLSSSGTSHVTGGLANDFITNKLDIDYFGTVRGRIGFAAERALIYATGGLAYGGVAFSEDKQNIVDRDAYVTATNDATLTGYVVGGGVEYKLTNSWSVKAEYQYLDLGSISVTGPRVAYPGQPTATGNATSETDVNFHTVRVGLNYKLGGDYIPLK